MELDTKKTIYLIRHGQTDYNLKGIIQGAGVNSELNNTGQEQARLFYKHYNHIEFDNIYTSELTRTQQTVHPFLQKGFSSESLSELNEINWGLFEGLESTPERHGVYQRILKSWKNGDFTDVIENGESPLDMYSRQEKGLKLLMSKTNEEQILVCSHGRAMRSLLCLMTNTNLSKMDNFSHSNVCLYVLEHIGNMKFEIRVRNSIEHLEALIQD